MEAQFLEMPRSTSQIPSSPSVLAVRGALWRLGARRVTMSSPLLERILRVDLLSSSLATGPLCLSVLSFRPASPLPTPLLSEAALWTSPPPSLSAASALVAPGLQVGTFTGAPVRRLACSPGAPRCRGPGQVQAGRRGSQLTWAAERKALSLFGLFGKAPFPLCLSS